MSTVDGAVTRQENVAEAPPLIRATDGGDAAPTVHPAGAVSAGRTSVAAGAPAGIRTVAVAVNDCPAVAVSGADSATAAVGSGGIVYRPS